MTDTFLARPRDVAESVKSQATGEAHTGSSPNRPGHKGTGALFFTISL